MCHLRKSLLRKFHPLTIKEVTIVQEPLAQIQDVAQTVATICRIPIEDIEDLFLASPVARINWASHVILLNSSLPLGVEYWYMKQSVRNGMEQQCP